MKREDKKKKLLEFIKKKKEERRKTIPQSEKFKDIRKVEHFQREISNKERMSAEEKDFKLNSKRKKERRDKFLELIVKKREEEKRRLELEKEQSSSKWPNQNKKRSKEIRNKQKLLQFLHQKKLLNQIEKEKSLLFIKIKNLERIIGKDKDAEIINKKKEGKPKLEVNRGELQKKEISQQGKPKVNSSFLPIFKTTSEIEKLVNTQILESERNINNFVRKFKEGKPKEKTSPKVPKKEKIGPEKRAKPVGYKEPFKLDVFLRRNIFKLVFLILLGAWIFQFLIYMKKRSLTTEERLRRIVGEPIIEEEKPKKEKEKVEEEKLVYWTREKIDIEGKRDPFSTGRLTMEVMKKPVPTNIIFVKKPEVISIVKTPKLVSILKPEKIEVPETPALPEVPSLQVPQVPTLPKVPTFEKPTIPRGREVSSPSLPEIKKVSKQPITPFVLPEKECPLVYRGRMILEGVEYIFIEGTKRTYRVTVGDTVEGYRILKKEDKKIILSKDGLLYEINAE